MCPRPNPGEHARLSFKMRQRSLECLPRAAARPPAWPRRKYNHTWFGSGELAQEAFPSNSCPRWCSNLGQDDFPSSATHPSLSHVQARGLVSRSGELAQEVFPSNSCPRWCGNLAQDDFPSSAKQPCNECQLAFHSLAFLRVARLMCLSFFWSHQHQS